MVFVRLCIDLPNISEHIQEGDARYIDSVKTKHRRIGLHEKLKLK